MLTVLHMLDSTATRKAAHSLPARSQGAEVNALKKM